MMEQQGRRLPVVCMKRRRTFTVLLCASAAATAAWGGHELPIYPSFYPHEIDIQTLAPEKAEAALRDAKVHAFVGRGASVPAAPPDTINTSPFNFDRYGVRVPAVIVSPFIRPQTVLRPPAGVPFP